MAVGVAVGLAPTGPEEPPTVAAIKNHQLLIRHRVADSN